MTTVAAVAGCVLMGGGAARGGDAVDALLAETACPARHAGYTPDFTWAREEFDLPESKEKRQAFLVIKDHDRYVAVLHEGMAQLDMIAFDPARTVAHPPFQGYYSWGKLLGTRILAACWYDGMGHSGRIAYEFTGGGSNLTLTTRQTWSGARTGESVYAMNLRCDPVLGYVWDMRTDMRIKPPARDKSGALERPEFFNWQVRVTGWTRRHDNPRWPAAWTHERTVFLNREDRLVGFFMNPEANDRSRFKRTEVREGGFVAMLPDREGRGVALVHARKGAASTPNATCNMWADSHNYLTLSTQPDAQGFHTASGEWRFLELPAPAVTAILARVEMDNLGH